MRILHSQTEFRLDDQLETDAAVDKLALIYGSSVITKRVVNPDGYFKFLLENWGVEDLINVEQDIVVTEDIIDSFIDCHELACTVPYCYPWKSMDTWSLYSGKPYPLGLDGKPLTFFDNDGAINLNAGLQFMEMQPYKPPFPDFVECSGLGMVKIRLELQQKIPFHSYPFAKFKWSFTDVWLSMYMQQKLDVKWHVHNLPVKHNHYVDYGMGQW